MKKTPLPIGMRRSKRLCLSFLVINFATKHLQPVEQGILPPAAYTLGTLVKKQFLSVAKLLLGSCEGKTENRHYFKLKKCDESCRGSIMPNNLFKSCLQSHCSDNGDQRLLSRVWRKSWDKSRKNSLWHPGYIVHFMPSQQSRTPLPYHVKLFRDFFFERLMIAEKYQ